MTQTILATVAALIVVLVGALVAWRYAARRWALPCPEWLSWLLTNPLRREGAGSAPVLSRLGLRPGMRVLDVGCGPGRVSIPAARLVGPQGEVVAVDVQDAMLKKLQRQAAARGVANIRTILGPIESAALEPGSYDRAVLVQAPQPLPTAPAAAPPTVGLRTYSGPPAGGLSFIRG